MTHILKTLKHHLSHELSEFFMEMKDELELNKEDYRNHFRRLSDILLEIDECDTFNKLEALYNSGEIDICGNNFEEYVYNIVKKLSQ